jgi:ABC-type transport system involved in cytochrome c biogenesis permease subunit
MVTILVYAFIAHMHNIRGFRGIYAMSLASLAGFGSVLMTYFGVNYYLSGLHSYAGGEPVPIPAGVYVAVSLVVLLAITSFVAYKRRKTSEG